MTYTTEAVASLRALPEEPRVIEGTAMPYGQVTEGAMEFGREAFDRGAFSTDAARWMSREDGAKLSFRPRHKQRAVGTVIGLTDTGDELRFRARIFDTPEGDAYLREVAAGINGVSVEFLPVPGKTVRRAGVAVHREARLIAIAGADAPAYDGARVMLRDLEDNEVTENPTEAVQEREAETQTAEVAPQERAHAERQTIESVVAQGRPSITITRPEYIYGPGRETSFLRDAMTRNTDAGANERQTRHFAMLTEITGQLERAGDILQSEIPGALPTQFLPGLVTPAVRQDTPMSSFYQTYAISNPQPKTFAKVTTSTAVSTTAKTEGAAPTVTDLATTAVTVTPAVYAAQIDVSREVIDASDPAAESMLMYDLTARFNETVESVVKTAVEAGSSASGTAITAATPFAGVLGNVNAYYAARYTEGAAQFVPSALFAVLLSQLDTSGRPLLPYVNPFNASGAVMAGGASAWLNGAQIKLSPKSTTNVVVTGAPTDFVIYRSPMLTFRFSEVVGPQSIRIAVFGYLGIGTRLGSLKVTAA